MVKNLISNYVPHEAVTFDDINPQWINKNGKEVIVEKNEMYKRYFEESKDPPPKKKKKKNFEMKKNLDVFKTTGIQ